MVKARRSNYVFLTWKGKHSPWHVHVYRRGRLLLKWDLQDKELGREAFTYLFASGAEGTVHIDYVFEYNEDPGYMRDLMLHRLTLEVQGRVESSPLNKREMIRRLGTSATQFYGILDQTNYRKSLDQLLSLLHVLDCEVDLVVRDRAANTV